MFCFRSDNKLRYQNVYAFVSISLTLLVQVYHMHKFTLVFCPKKLNIHNGIQDMFEICRNLYLLYEYPFRHGIPQRTDVHQKVVNLPPFAVQKKLKLLEISM